MKTLDWSLEDLARELLHETPASILPQNLSDIWLQRLHQAAECAAKGKDSCPEVDFAFTAMTQIVAHAVAEQRQHCPQDLYIGGVFLHLRQLWRHMDDYRRALERERIARQLGEHEETTAVADLFPFRRVRREMHDLHRHS